MNLGPRWTELDWIRVTSQSHDERRESLKHTWIIKPTWLACPWNGCELLWWVCMSVCLSVCFSVHVTWRTHGSTSYQILCVLRRPCTALTTSDGVAICYVLPVLCMTSFFHTMAHIKAIKHCKQNSRDSNKILLNDKDREYSLGVKCRGRNVMSTIVLFIHVATIIALFWLLGLDQESNKLLQHHIMITQNKNFSTFCIKHNFLFSFNWQHLDGTFVRRDVLYSHKSTTVTMNMFCKSVLKSSDPRPSTSLQLASYRRNQRRDGYVIISEPCCVDAEQQLWNIR